MQRHREFIGIGVAVLASLTLLGLPAHQQERIAQTLRGTAWSTGQWVFSRVIRFARHQEESGYLRTQSVQLSLENMRLREAAEENRRLRQALRFRQPSQIGEVIPAQVIGRDPDQMFGVLIVNAGRDMGLQQDWPVVTTAGLVGHIQSVDAASAVVRLIFDARVSALVHGSRAQGIVSPLAGNRFELAYVAASETVAVGDTVVSSGMGGRYPKGITIGQVTSVDTRDDDPLFKRVVLESAVDFWGLEEVFVIRPGGGRQTATAPAGPGLPR